MFNYWSQWCGVPFPRLPCSFCGQQRNQKMKRIAYFLLAALSVVACEKAQVEKGNPTPTPATPSHFTFEVSEIGTGSCVVNITPDDTTKTYYMALVEKRDLDKKGSTFSEQAAAYMDGEFDFYVEEELVNTRKEAVATLASKGKIQDKVASYLAGNQPFVLFASYIDADGKTLGDGFEKYEFSTLAPEPSDNELSLKIVSYNSRAINVEVTTTNDDPYGIIALESGELKDLKTDEEIMEYITYNYLYMTVVNGDITATNENAYNSTIEVKAGREYTIAVFGVQDYCPTTALVKATVTTPATSDPKNFSITADFTEGPVNGYQLKYTVNPNDSGIDYLYDLFPANYTVEQATKDFDTYCEKKSANIGATRAEFVELMATYGQETYWEPVAVTPGSSYRVFAIAVNTDDGSFYSDAVYSDPITISAPKTSTATVEVSFSKYYDRDAVVALNSEYSYLVGQVIFNPTVTKSEDADSYYYYPFKYEGPDAYTRDQILSKLISTGVTYEMTNWVSYDTDAVIYAVAVDAERNCGELFEYVFKLSKSGVSPAQEFIDEMNSKYMYSASAKATTAAKSDKKKPQAAGCAVLGPVQF